MHYYSFNVADYRKDTTHLNPIEHYIYRTLIDWYYLDEMPIPLDTQLVLRKLGLSEDNNQNLLNILEEFFVYSNFGYEHFRIEKDIAHYHQNAEKNRENGKKGGRPKTQSVANGIPMETQPKGNQEPITKNQKTKIKDDFAISKYVHSWGMENKYTNDALEKHRKYFILACKSQGYEKESWDDFFIKAIIDNWAKLPNPKGGVVM